MASKFLIFQVIGEKPKTKIYAVDSRRSGDRLGLIEWYSGWRQYCFEPEPSTVWSHECLADLAGFLKNLMHEHKENSDAR